MVLITITFLTEQAIFEIGCSKDENIKRSIGRFFYIKIIAFHKLITIYKLLKETGFWQSDLTLRNKSIYIFLR